MASIPPDPTSRNADATETALELEFEAALTAAFEFALTEKNVPRQVRGWPDITVTLKAVEPAPPWARELVTAMQDPQDDAAGLRAHAATLAHFIEGFAPECARALRAPLPPAAGWSVEIDPELGHVAAFQVRDLRGWGTS